MLCPEHLYNEGLQDIIFHRRDTIGNMYKGLKKAKGQLMRNRIGWSEAEGKAVARYERCWSAASDGERAGEGAQLWATWPQS